ncbi:MAG: Na+:solute symporter [Actinobacteria bacterium]|nr:Na+:solute symporter [Actinomycetota bacterium]
MQILDWMVLVAYFLVLIYIGFYALRRIKDSRDFFVAGGQVPWWLSGVSHHVSGYSGVVFVAYAGVAYTHGFTLYVWWAFGIFVAVFMASFLIAPRWSRLRMRLNIQSPTEYLAKRYSLPAQQVIAWSGMIIKIFDVGAKWAAIAVLLHVFTGTSTVVGIFLAGGVSLLYITVGGLWADVWNDFAQFLVQIVAGITMFVAVLIELGDGINGVWSVWERLPADHAHLLNPPYTLGFLAAIIFIDFFSYSGGTWNLAMRFISSPSGSEAQKAARLSAALYLLWPFILFFPMFAAPIFLPNLKDPTQSYALMALKFLPSGLVGLVLASMFANTLSMTASDSNTVSAVITRDILPQLFKKIKSYNKKQYLRLARITTFSFTLCTIIIAIKAESFGGVFGLIISWFAALLGPIAIPMILGLLPLFKHSDSKAAIVSIFGGIAGFILTKFVMTDASLALQLSLPVLSSAIVFVLMGFLNRKEVPPEVESLLKSLNYDGALRSE